MPLTLGTAGHIDHGKTALVQALTGVNTDRLPEEQARGISIALGYAALGPGISVVDVPGHERFVRTMVAGATGIDLYLMVVAADDGVMPQTREHATVLAALGVSIGVVAITKCDVADPSRAASEASELLPGAEIVPVSVRTGMGLDDLRAALARAAGRVVSRTGDGPLCLHVDRVFTIHGAGTVVTGTLWSGTAVRGDHVTVLPEGRRARIRSVEVHDAPIDRAEAGQRVALNLAGLARDEVARGDVIVASGAAGASGAATSGAADASGAAAGASGAADASGAAAARGAAGTGATASGAVEAGAAAADASGAAAARGAAGTGATASGAVEVGAAAADASGAAAARGAAGTGATASGAVEAGAAAAGASAVGRAAAGALPATTYRVDVALAWATPEARPEGGARIGVHHGTRESAARLVELGGRFFQLRLERPIVAAAGDRLVIRSLAPPDTLGGGVVLDPEPRRHGPSRDLLARLVRLERGEPEPEPEPEAQPAPTTLAPLSPEALALEEQLRQAGHAPPLDEQPELLAELRAHGRAVRLGPAMHVHPDALADVQRRLVAVIERDGAITLAQLRDELQTSRKYAQAYLEHFDGAKLTLRRGDARVLRRRAR